MSTDSTSTSGANSDIPPALRRRLEQLLKHGKSLTANRGKEDYDYANDMFSECVIHDPGNLEYVEVFLDNLSKKFGNNKKGGKTTVTGDRGAFKKAIKEEDHEAVLKLGPALLAANPWDVSVLRPMAEACATRRFNDVELRYLKNALDANPKDVDVNKHCAKTLARVGQIDQAISCWHRIEELRPNDKEPQKMISDLTLAKASGAVSVGDDPAAKTPAPEEKKEEEAKPQEEAVRREIQLTPRQQLERTLGQDPSNVEVVTQLYELLYKEKRLGDAEQLLVRSQHTVDDAGKAKLQPMLEDVQIERLKQSVSVAEKRLEKLGTGEARDQLKQARVRLVEMETKVYSQRMEKEPDNLNHVLAMAGVVRRKGDMAEAVKLYQKAREDQALKPRATLELGECMQQLKQFPKARECYKRAAELAEAEQQASILKASLYRLGVLCEGLKETDLALNSLRTLVKLDPGFRDAKVRLDKLQTKAQNA